MFGLFAVAGFGVVIGAPLLLLVAAALAAPSLILTDSTDVMPTSQEGPSLLPEVSGAIREPAHAAV